MYISERVMNASSELQQLVDGNPKQYSIFVDQQYWNILANDIQIMLIWANHWQFRPGALPC